MQAAGVVAGAAIVIYLVGAAIDLQYWFFYPYNYYPTVATPDLMNAAPVAGDVINTDLHQGDWEHIDVLIDHRTRRPVWLYLARHSDEGQWYPWGDPAVPLQDGHPVVQAALGGHSTYDPHCGARRRFAHGLGGVVSDWVVCGSGGSPSAPPPHRSSTSRACRGRAGRATSGSPGPARSAPPSRRARSS